MSYWGKAFETAELPTTNQGDETNYCDIEFFVTIVSKIIRNDGKPKFPKFVSLDKCVLTVIPRKRFLHQQTND